jgi:hypothetical protein
VGRLDSPIVTGRFFNNVTSFSASGSRLAEKLRASHYWGGCIFADSGWARRFSPPQIECQSSPDWPMVPAIQATADLAETTRCVVFQGSWQLRSQARRPAWHSAPSTATTPTLALPYRASGRCSAPGVLWGAGSRGATGKVRCSPVRDWPARGNWPEVGGGAA